MNILTLIYGANLDFNVFNFFSLAEVDLQLIGKLRDAIRKSW